MKRKTFLISCIGVIGLLTTRTVYSWWSRKQAIISPEMLSQLCTTQQINAIGQEYVRNFPAENSRSKLLYLTKQTDSLSISQIFESTTKHRQALETQIADDFLQERTVVMDGWIISKTEARQCALHYLEQTQDAH